MPVGEPHPSSPSERLKRHALPSLIGAGLCLAVLALWAGLQNQTHRDHLLLSGDHADKVASYIEADLSSRLLALQRMANRWEARGGTPQHEFLADAQSYIRDLKGFRGIAWADPSFTVRWEAPLVGEEVERGLVLVPEDLRERHLAQAHKRWRAVMSPPFALDDKGQVVLVSIPLNVNGRFDGFVLAALDCAPWLSSAIDVREQMTPDKLYAVAVTFDGVPVFRQPGWASARGSSVQAHSSFITMGHEITVLVAPTPSFFKVYDAQLPHLAALVGLLLSALVTGVISLLQRESRARQLAQEAKDATQAALRQKQDAERELVQTSHRLTLATHTGAIGVWSLDLASDLLTWNELMFSLYGLPHGPSPTRAQWQRLVHPADLESAKELLGAVLNERKRYENEFRIVRPDGSLRILRIAADVDCGPDNEPLRIIGVQWDVTEQRAIALEFAHQRRRLADIIEGTNVGTWEWNLQTGETLFNERWAAMVGHSLQALSSTWFETWLRFVHPDDLHAVETATRRYLNAEVDSFDVEVRLIHKDGHLVWVHDRGRISRWADSGEPLWMSGTRQDITARKLSEQRIRHLADHDALTDLPSLRLAKDRLHMAVQMAKRAGNLAAVLFIDLDGFKAVNDTHGHDAGDVLLKAVATRLTSCVRETDTVARIGGDEFLAVLVGLSSPQDAGLVAERMVELLSLPLAHCGSQLSIGASVGIALYPHDADDDQALLRRADEAMYTVKSSGKNGFAYYSPPRQAQGSPLGMDAVAGTQLARAASVEQDVAIS